MLFLYCRIWSRAKSTVFKHFVTFIASLGYLDAVLHFEKILLLIVRTMEAGLVNSNSNGRAGFYRTEGALFCFQQPSS